MHFFVDTIGDNLWVGGCVASRTLPWLRAMRTGCWYLSGLNGCRAQTTYLWWQSAAEDRVAHMVAIGGHIFRRLTPHRLFVPWVEKLVRSLVVIRFPWATERQVLKAIETIASFVFPSAALPV